MEIKDVENLARLARIELKEDEKNELLSDMDSVLGYMKQIETMKIEETESVYQAYNVWREDEIQERASERELIISQFPNSQDGYLKVKKIL